MELTTIQIYSDDLPRFNELKLKQALKHEKRETPTSMELFRYLLKNAAESSSSES